MPKDVSDSKNSRPIVRPHDIRLSEGGIWRRLLPPNDKVRVLKISQPGKGQFRGEMTVRIKPLEGGQTVNYIEDDFLVLFEPIMSAVRED